jgi:putative membrane protein
MKLLARWIMGAMAVMAADWMLTGIVVPNFLTGMLVTAVLVLLNIAVKPILVLLTIPFTVFTMGLFLLVINAVIILLAGEIVPGFTVTGFWPALWFSLLFAVVQSILEGINRGFERKYQRNS